MDGDPEGYATKDDVADYLEHYADVHRLPIALNEAVTRMERRGARFHALTSRGRRVASRAVIVTTGPFQQAFVPAFAAKLSTSVVQWRADEYRRPAQVPSGTVVVVGGGATGRQIARELAATHRVSLALGRPVSITPQRVLGRDVMAWFDAAGVLRADKASLRGRLAHARESFPGRHLGNRALRRLGVRPPASCHDRHRRGPALRGRVRRAVRRSGLGDGLRRSQRVARHAGGARRRRPPSGGLRPLARRGTVLRRPPLATQPGVGATVRRRRRCGANRRPGAGVARRPADDVTLPTLSWRRPGVHGGPSRACLTSSDTGCWPIQWSRNAAMRS